MEGEILSGDPAVKRAYDGRGFMARVYLFIAAPALILLCFLTQPLHSLDEPAHFLRVVQLSSGSVAPVLGPDRASTGSYAGLGAREFARFYGIPYENYWQRQKKVTLSELSKLYAIRNNQGGAAFIQHSNTTIYFPLAYSAPVAAVYVARMFTDRPLIWLYAGRLANALFGVVLTYIILSHATRARLLFFATALLPITLFQTAALSADSLLIPAVMALALIFGRVLEGRSLSATEYVVAAIAGAFVGLGKFAYLPLVLILPLVAILTRRRLDRTVVWLTLIASAIVVIWLLWSLEIRNLVFTVRQDIPASAVDVQAQFARILAHPLVFAKAVRATLGIVDLKKDFYSFSGGVIGWLDIWLPLPLACLNFVVLSSTVLIDDQTRRTSIPARLVIFIALFASVLSVFLLLYLQWSPVGARRIDGIQGRYFLPLLPLACAATPSLVLGRNRIRLFSLGLVGWGCISVAVTLVSVTLRYWL